MAGIFGGPSGPAPQDLRAQEEKEQREQLAADRNAARRQAARRGVSSLLSTGLVIPGQNNGGGA
jgi:hypothetical protein